MGTEGIHVFTGTRNSHIQYICSHVLIMAVTILYIQLHVSTAMSSWLHIIGLEQIYQNPANQNNFMNVSL